MTFHKRLHDVKTNVEATFLKRFCAGWTNDRNWFFYNNKAENICRLLHYEMFKVQWSVNLDEYHHVSQYIVTSASLYCIFHITLMYHAFYSSLCTFMYHVLYIWLCIFTFSLLLIALESKRCQSNNSTWFLSKT